MYNQLQKPEHTLEPSNDISIEAYLSINSTVVKVVSSQKKFDSGFGNGRVIMRNSENTLNTRGRNGKEVTESRNSRITTL